MNIKSKMTLIKRWIGIVRGKNAVAIKQGPGQIYSIEEVRGYYNDLTGKVSEKTPLDSEGIPTNKIVGGKTVYFPITIFQYALGVWDKYLLEAKECYLKDFKKLSDWILNNQREDGSWDCFSPIGHTKYTVSSMGQGEAISVLVRRYLVDSDLKYFHGAKKAAEFMIKPVDEGGTLIIEGSKYILEEYPNNKEKRSSVLNGWIFSLFGLYDYLKVEDNPAIRDIYEKSVDTLAIELSKYDTGYWTYYDQIGRMASPAYHELHIALLKVMSEITGKDIFNTYSIKWQKYNENKNNKMKAIAIKVMQKLKENSEGVITE